MVFISQPHPAANDNHWAAGSYAAKIIAMAVCQTSGSFRELQRLQRRAREVVGCVVQGKARTRGFLQSRDSECILRWHEIAELRVATRRCQPGHGQNVALGVTEVPEQRALLAARKRSINRLSRERRSR